MSIKVLQINSVCGRGSTGKIALDLAKGLRDKGHDCLIAYGRGDCGDFDNTFKITSNWGVKIHAVLTRLFDTHGLHSDDATKKFIKKITEYNPDIIHIHNLHGYYINYKILFDYLKQAGKPVVWTLHDCWAFTGHCSYYDFARCDKWQKQCRDCPQTGEYPKSFRDNSKNNYIIKKEAFCGVENLIIVTPSQWLKNEVKKSFLKDYQVKVIKNGINTGIFKPAESAQSKIDDKKIIILGVTNIWNKRKGLRDFEKLYNILPQDRYKIVLAGLNKKQLKSLPLGMVKIARTNSAYELAALYSAADVYVNPTYEDNYPTTNLEAQSCGTPVITYNTGGCAETLSSEIAANKVIAKGDIEALAEAIKTVQKKTSPAVFDNTFLAKENFVAQYISLYENIIKNSV